MLFKHPNLLWFLFLLIIPILVHLLQLRQWKKEYFTNVKLLQQLQMQSNKSSQLKKWLLLLSRLLFLIMVILAFAQPFFPSKKIQTQSSELVFVLDNSHSMAAKTKQGVLLKKSIEELLEGLSDNTIFDLYSINEQYLNKDKTLIKQDLLALDYFPQPFNLDKIFNKIAQRNTETPKDIIVITDGLNDLPDLNKQSSNWNIKYFIPKIEQTSNVSIDTVYLTKTNTQFHNIAVKFMVDGEANQDMPIAIFNNNQLVAKSTKTIKNQEILYFDLPKADFHGFVEIQDNALDYDNRYYFTITNPPKPKVLVVGPSNKQTYLQKIFTAEDADLTLVNQISQNAINNNFDVIILNELVGWSQEISLSLQSYLDAGGTLVMIPDEKTSVQNLQALTQNFGISWKPFKTQEQMIQKVFFAHPLFQGVFESEVKNFAYPKIKGFFEVSTNLPTVMAYLDGLPFLVSSNNSQGNLFVFTAPLHEPWSDFKQTPLIVPVFYNMALQTSNSGMQTAWLMQETPVFLNLNLAKDQLVSFENNGENVIPIQQNLQQKTKINLSEAPTKPGNYDVLQDKTKIDVYSLNIKRTESKISKQLWKDNSHISVIPSLTNYIAELKTSSQNTNLWKWFVSLGLLFLVVETLIQKFLK